MHVVRVVMVVVVVVVVVVPIWLLVAACGARPSGRRHMLLACACRAPPSIIHPMAHVNLDGQVHLEPPPALLSSGGAWADGALTACAVEAREMGGATREPLERCAPRGVVSCGSAPPRLVHHSTSSFLISALLYAPGQTPPVLGT